MKAKKKSVAEPTGVLGITTEQPIQPDSFKSLLIPLQHQSLVKLHTQGGIEQGEDRTATRIFFKLGKLPSDNNVYFMLSDLHQLIGSLQPEYLLLFHFPDKGQYLWWHCKPASAAGILEEELPAMKQLDSSLIGYPMNSGYQLINSWYGARESVGCQQWFDAGCPEPGWSPMPI